MSGIDRAFGPEAEPAPAAAPDEFDRAWRTPRWLGALVAVNHVMIGRRYLVTSFVFLLIGGLEALAMRTQLSRPDNHLLSAYQYNEIMTVHGTTMMFLFGTPVMLATAIFLIPAIIGARDIAFPRLTAFGYWIYLAGGLLLYSSFLVDGAPKSGWWSYQPLTSLEYEPHRGQDFWYFAVALIETGSTVSAIELITTILKSRAPGASINHMPLYAWYVLGTSFMIVFSFPVVIVSALMAEAERGLGMPFFTPSGNGRPLLWEHLFWFWCHPEVYVIFLPGSGLVTEILPTFARHRLTDYAWIVLAVVATVFFSFGVWVHHMFTTGIPRTALSFFSGTTMSVAVPSGVQIFSYLALLWIGKPVFKTPLLFVLGFVFIFTLGGLSGVSLGAVPFNWQVHDTYYVVAHFHYVIIGGMLFPFFAALHYYMPLVSGRMMSEQLGKLSFWLMFLGFNLAFFPMHISGFWGMPRRIYTYPASSGWGPTNLASTIGAYVLAAGILMVVVNIVRHRWRGVAAGINPWGAGTLEWATPLPITEYKFRSIPEVHSSYPLWDDGELPERIRRGEGLLARVHGGAKETLTTSMISAEPQDIKWLPRPSVMPLLAALSLTLIAAALLARRPWLAVGGAAAALLSIAVWMWDHKPPVHEIDAGHGVMLPVNAGDRSSSERVGMLLFLMADFTAFAAIVWEYFYYWGTSAVWPPSGYVVGHQRLAWIATAMLAASLPLSLLARLAGKAARIVFMAPAMLLSGVLLGASVWCFWRILSNAGFDYTNDAYAATVFSLLGFCGLHLIFGPLMLAWSIARGLAGHISRRRYLAADNAGLFAMYAAVQALAALGIVYL